ncbi:MAG: Clp protease ClpP [Planctomycetes bacterium]|nr:Clp protease ClpP [Planctomycetota bacterium]
MPSKTIFLYGEVGWEIDANFFATDTENLTKNDTVNVRIFSGGGSVFVGFAIYNIMKRSEAIFNVYIDGMAGSIASIIAMGANKVFVSEGSMMMIHKASLLDYGNSDQLAESAEVLKQIDAELVAVYEKKTGLSADVLNEMMQSDNYLTSKELLEKGFADEYDDQPIKAVAYREILNTMKGKNMSKEKEAEVLEPEVVVEPEKVEPEKVEPEVVETKEEIEARVRAEMQAEQELAVKNALQAKIILDKGIDDSIIHSGQAELIAALKNEEGMTFELANVRINADYRARQSTFKTESVLETMKNEAPKATIGSEILSEGSEKSKHVTNWKKLLDEHKNIEATEYFNKHIKGA